MAKVEKIPNFPMKFSEFLRRAFGGRLYSDRLHLFRKFAISYYGEEVAPKMIEALKKHGFNNPPFYYQLLQDINDWRPKNRNQQRKDANKSRWLKESRKKILTVLKKRITAISHQ